MNGKKAKKLRRLSRVAMEVTAGTSDQLSEQTTYVVKEHKKLKGESSFQYLLDRNCLRHCYHQFKAWSNAKVWT